MFYVLYHPQGLRRLHVLEERFAKATCCSTGRLDQHFIMDTNGAFCVSGSFSSSCLFFCVFFWWGQETCNLFWYVVCCHHCSCLISVSCFALAFLQNVTNWNLALPCTGALWFSQILNYSSANSSAPWLHVDQANVADLTKSRGGSPCSFLGWVGKNTESWNSFAYKGWSVIPDILLQHLKVIPLP